MLGKTIRSLGHLVRNLEYNTPRYLILSQVEGQIMEGEVIKINDGVTDQLLFFNTRRGDSFYSRMINNYCELGKDIVDTIHNLDRKYGSVFNFYLHEMRSNLSWNQLSYSMLNLKVFCYFHKIFQNLPKNLKVTILQLNYLVDSTIS